MTYMYQQLSLTFEDQDKIFKKCYLYIQQYLPPPVPPRVIGAVQMSIVGYGLLVTIFTKTKGRGHHII